MKAQGTGYIDATPNVSLISVVTDQTQVSDSETSSPLQCTPPPNNMAALEWINALLYTLPLQAGPEGNVDLADPWLQLALSIVQQSLKDAAMGDHNALTWLIDEGRVWLEDLGISPLIVDSWAAILW